MKAMTLACAVVLGGGALLSQTAAAQAPARAGAPAMQATVGPASRLAIHDGVLVYCDGRGGRRFDPRTGRGGTEPLACPADPEGNAACSDVPAVSAVRGPLTEPDDIVDLDGGSISVRGRVHDCAGDGQSVAVVTGSQVVLIDVKRQTSRIVSREGGERVALGPGWIAWTSLGKVHMAPR